MQRGFCHGLLRVLAMRGGDWRARYGVRAVLIALMAGGILAAAGRPGAAQESTDWASQNLNLDNNRFAPIAEIHSGNVGRLAPRWTYEVGPADNIAQVTPLVVGGVMYLHSRSTLFALDAATGEERWRAVLDAGSESGSAGCYWPPSAAASSRRAPVSTFSIA